MAINVDYNEIDNLDSNLNYGGSFGIDIQPLDFSDFTLRPFSLNPNFTFQPFEFNLADIPPIDIAPLNTRDIEDIVVEVGNIVKSGGDGYVLNTTETVTVESVPISKELEVFKETELTSASQLLTGPGTFQFIVSFGNGKYYTSTSFKSRLLSAETKKDRYFNVRTAPIIKLDGALLSAYFNRNKFKLAELYTEVEVTKTISTAEEMLLHIDWLTTQGKEFRYTDNGKSISVKGKNIAGIGSWNITHTPAGNIGFGFEDLYNLSQDDEDFGNQQYSGQGPTSEFVVPRPGDTSSNSLYGQAPPLSNIISVPLFPPFETAGTSPGERRVHEDSAYFWNPQQSKWRGQDSLTFEDKETTLEYFDAGEYALYLNDVAMGRFGDRDDPGSDIDDRDRFLESALDFL